MEYHSMTHGEFLTYKNSAEQLTEHQEYLITEHILLGCTEGDCPKERTRILSAQNEPSE